MRLHSTLYYCKSLEEQYHSLLNWLPVRSMKTSVNIFHMMDGSCRNEQVESHVQVGREGRRADSLFRGAAGTGMTKNWIGERVNRLHKNILGYLIYS